MILRIEGKTREDRYSIQDAASDVVRAAGGYILDYKQFSNLAVCYTIELPSGGFAKLRQKLTDLHVILEPATAEELAVDGRSPQDDIPGSLRITFIHQEPDLRIPIPAVPG